MNELLQRHGCSNVFTIPEGLKELMADISREVLRDQPPKIFEYIANYLSVLLMTREHGLLAAKILDDLCDCRPSVSEHLLQIGLEKHEVDMLSQIIKEEIEGFAPKEGKETVKEAQILKKVLARTSLDEEMAARVCQVARNAYRDYWYRKSLMEKNMQVRSDEPWEKAAQRTLELYKTTKPSYSELTRATQKIQAAYRGYYVRRSMQRSAPAQWRPAVELPGAPLDVAGSRDLDLGPLINVTVREEDTTREFDEVVGKSLNLKYDPMKTITHVTETLPAETLKVKSDTSTRKSLVPAKSAGDSSQMMRKATVVGMDDRAPVVDQSPSGVPLTEMPIEKRRSHFTEASLDPSRASSKRITPLSSTNKISFSGLEDKEEIIEIQQLHPAEVSIPEEAPPVTVDAPKIVDALAVEDAQTLEESPAVEVAPLDEATEAEIPEELPPTALAAVEEVQDIPEDIPVEPAPDIVPEVEDSAPGTESAPLPSAASSAPGTDVDTAGEEEGE